MHGADSMQKVRHISRQRLYPWLTNPNWLILSVRRKRLTSGCRGFQAPPCTCSMSVGAFSRCRVLEYIADPRTAIAEMHRCLKPGDFLLLSVAAVFPRDSEVEYWRLLPGAIRHLLADFSRVELVPEGNSLVGFLRTVNVC